MICGIYTSIDLRDRSDIQYILHILNAHPLCPLDWTFVWHPDTADVKLSYGPHGVESDWSIPAQGLIFSDHIVDTSRLSANVYTYCDQNLYSVEQEHQATSKLILGNKFGFDLFEMIFFHLTRYEEYHCDKQKKDQWDMLGEQHHFLVRHGIEKHAVLDQLLVAFYQIITGQEIRQETRYAISHDIDVLRKFKNPIRVLRAISRDILERRSALSTARAYIETLISRAKDPYDSFDFLFANEKHTWHHKVIFVMAGGQSRYDGYYGLDEPILRDMIASALKSGYEIGLHPSYESYRSDHLIPTEKSKLEEALKTQIRSSRQHFLKFDFPKTIQILSRAGIKNDHTLGYQRIIGFRCGTGFPYRLYDLERRQMTDITEWPMIIMDGALLDEAHGNLLKAQNILNSLLSSHQYNSYISYNIHNSIFDRTRRDESGLKTLLGYE